MLTKIPILDHGYLALVETWGSDERIVEAARMSTGKGFQGWGPRCKHCGEEFDTDRHPSCFNHPLRKEGRDAGHEDVPGDEKLLAYLYANKHMTPFEMGGFIVEVQAPIFVFREWHRHRTQSYNEMSSRYEPLPDVNYIPSAARLLVNAGGTNKQAGTVKGASVLTEANAENFREQLRHSYSQSQALYELALKDGVPKELARVHLPVGRYSRMRASANLRNWFAFLTLRMDGAAQWEIRQYANAVGSLLAEMFPRTWALFSPGA